MSSSDIPEDSVPREHAEPVEKRQLPDAEGQPPTDSVLRRDYDQMHNLAAETTDRPAPPPPSSGVESALREEDIAVFNVPIYKTLLLMGLLAIVGVIALYNWYSEKLKGTIAERETAISESAQKLTEANTKLGLSAENMQATKAEMEATAKQHQQAVQRLTADAARRHEALSAEAASLHQTAIEETEQRLSARVAFFRTALQGSEPERAEQLTSLDQQITSIDQDLDDARRTIASVNASKAELDQQLAAANVELQQGQQAIVQSGRELAAVQEKLAQRQTALLDLKSEYDAARDQAATDQAALREEMRSADEAHSATMSAAEALLERTKTTAAQAGASATALLERTNADATAAMQQAKNQHSAQITQAKGVIANLDQELNSERAALAALQEQYDTNVAELKTNLASTEQTLSATNAELSTTIAAATAAKEALEGEIAAQKTRIADLEQSIAAERQQAAQRLFATQQEHGDSLAYLNNLYADLSTLGGTQTQQGMLLSLADSELRFRIGGTKLPRGKLPNLDRIAELLNKYPNLHARIEGHTDNSGRDETNMELSNQRANAVMAAFVERGVAEGRMTAEGFGEGRPIASNNTPANRRKNRRVEVYVSEGDLIR